MIHWLFSTPDTPTICMVSRGVFNDIQIISMFTANSDVPVFDVSSEGKC